MSTTTSIETTTVREGSLLDRGWQLAVGATFVVGLLRVNPTVELLHPYVWLALQTLPLLAVTVAMVVRSGRVEADRRLRWVALTAAALTAFCALSSVWSATPFRTLTQSGLMALAWAFLYVTASRRWRDGVPGRDVALVFWLAAAVLVVSVVLRVAGVDDTVGVGRRLQGVVGNPNYLGMLLTAMLALVAVLLVLGRSARQAMALSAATGVAVVALLWCGSRGSLLAAALAAVVALVSPEVRREIGRRWPHILGGLAAGAAICALAWTFAPYVDAPESTTSNLRGEHSRSDSLGSMFDRGEVESGFTTGRTEIWKESLRAAGEHPIIGTGYRTSEVESDGNLTAHNLVLSYLLETGVVGVLFFLLVIGALIWCGWTRHPLRIALLAGVTAIAVQEQVEASLQSFTGPVSILQWLIVFAFAASGAAARRNDVQHDPGATT